jgi:molybdopterin-guanine dinucleotide biosynthesis protein A
MKLSGAVLAGGKSRRMGRDKSRLRVAGEPFWRRQWRVLRESGARPAVLVQAPGQRALTRRRSVRVLRDRFENAGPLAGLHAALGGTRAGFVAVLAVDMPAIEPRWFARLLAQCSPGRGAVIRSKSGYEPLAAIYPREALVEAEARLTRGEYSLQHFVAALVRSRRLRVLRASAADLPQLANWNTAADVRS